MHNMVPCFADISLHSRRLVFPIPLAALFLLGLLAFGHCSVAAFPDDGTKTTITIQSRFSLPCRDAAKSFRSNAADADDVAGTTWSSDSKSSSWADHVLPKARIRHGATSKSTTTVTRGLKNGRDDDNEEEYDDDRASEDADARAGKRYLYAHGSLMILGWGVLLPSGAIFARLAKHRPGGLWFRIHRALQVSGLVVVFTAWMIAVNFFDDVEVNDDNDNDDTHKSVGFIVMMLGMLQGINGLLRPHASHGGETKTYIRFWWEILHKTSGYLAVILAIFTIYLGTTLIPTATVRDKFQRVYFCGVGSVLVALIAGLLADKMLWRGRPAKEEAATAKGKMDTNEEAHVAVDPSDAAAGGDRDGEILSSHVP
eukprot:scaffold48_cov161-Amphora_coffeaeformis.AAC.14